MVKRLFDVVLALMLLVITSPFFVIITVFVLITSPGPVIYKGKRVGFKEKEFKIFKFRTMVINSDEKDGGSCTVSDDPRITPVGKILRQTKLDELPQLVNVLVGDMSFVGPRPDTPFYISKISKEDRKIIFSVRPGLTDEATLDLLNEEEELAKVEDPEKYYETVTLPFKVQKQKEYALNHSLGKDVSIMWRTFIGMI